MRDEIQAFKRERILQEAVRLFYERGFNGATLDDVAAALNVTKPFIYTHFRSKTELLAAICAPTIELSAAAAANAVQAAGRPRDRLRQLIHDFTRVVLGRQANIAIYFREEKHLSEKARAEINAKRKEFDHLLCRLLQEGVSEGEFSVADPPLAALALGGMISWAYTWHRHNGRLGLDELCNRMADLALLMAGDAGPREKTMGQATPQDSAILGKTPGLSASARSS